MNFSGIGPHGGEITIVSIGHVFSQITPYGIQHIVIYVSPESWKWPFPACIVKYEVPENKSENVKLEEGPECDSFWILKQFIDQWTEDYNINNPDINNPNINYSTMNKELASSKISTEPDSTTDKVVKDSAEGTDLLLPNGDQNASESSPLSPARVKKLPIQFSSLNSSDAAPRMTTELPTLQLG